jgi:hypothetical protein
MTPSWKLEVKIKAQKYVWDRKFNLRKVTVNYGRLVDFIRHASAEIWGWSMDSHFSWYSKNCGQYRCFRRTRTRTNTNPFDTKASAAGWSGCCVLKQVRARRAWRSRARKQGGVGKTQRARRLVFCVRECDSDSPVLVVVALKHSASGGGLQPRTILT